MKIGFVSPYSFAHAGGVQNHVFGLAGWLKAQGHQVAIFGPDEADPQLLASYGLTPSELTSSGPSIALPTNGSVARVNFGRKQVKLVKKWCRESNLDVAHIHEPLAPSVALLTLRHFNGPIVGTFHSSRSVSKLLRTLVRLNRKTVAKLSRTIAVSRVAHGVASFLYEVDPVIIGNGVPVAQHPVAKCTTKWRAGDHPRIIFVGRYDEPRKGFEVFRRAVSVVRTVYPDVEIVVVGKGSPRQDPGITFASFLSDAERDKLLASSDVYVAPNTGQESFGIVLIEALASGAPVVASDIPAFVDVLNGPEGMVGRVFRNGDSADLARQLLQSLADPRDLMLEKGLRRSQMFDWSNVGPQVVEQYLGAIADFGKK